MAPTKKDQLVTGKKYKLTYRNNDGKTMVLVGKYMGTNYANDLLFDLRPEAGTITIPADAFLAAAYAPLTRNVTPKRYGP